MLSAGGAMMLGKALPFDFWAPAGNGYAIILHGGGSSVAHKWRSTTDTKVSRKKKGKKNLAISLKDTHSGID